MSKHTPGEWKFGVRRDNSIWLSLGDPRKGPHYQGDLYASEADARLIAAAPELLAALKAAIELSDRRLTEAGRTEEAQAVYDQVASAIAKAEGLS
ncbi:hypothetical protein GOL29_03295 [Sinorhizobium medicae]|nr:hypothetical protein [Sinorhizobium medicae]